MSAAITAAQAGLIGCRRCAQVWPQDTARCGRCGAVLEPHHRRSLSRVWAWWTAGVLAYIPANLLPMLHTKTLLKESESTIIGGALELWHHGAYGVALIILIASVAIPISKFAAVAYLALSVGKGGAAHRRMHLLEAVEYIGRWSMIDVFVVAIMASLVQLGAAVSITPGPAALSFAACVVFTMLAARAFDSRLIWGAVLGDKVVKT